MAKYILSKIMSIKHKRKLEEEKTNAIFDKICKQLPPKTDTTAKT